jgi:hypothetical protein
MKRKRILLLICITAMICAHLMAVSSHRASAQSCEGQGAEGDLTGSKDTAVILGRAAATCTSDTSLSPRQRVPCYTFEIRCSPNSVASLGGICSATPCRSSFFALRTIHYPDGTSAPAGFQCVTLAQATPSPGITTAEVFAAIRRVKLPDGQIGAVPQLRGLANLESLLLRARRDPTAGRPAGGRVGGACGVPGGGVPVGVRGRPRSGDHGTGQRGPGQRGPGRAFGRRGRYRVGVTVLWTAAAFLEGRRVGQVDQLVSRAQTTYPVAEVRTILTG